MTERAKKLLLLYYKQSRKIRRVSGLPPLTFKAKKAGTLKNYRIYGQTVDGESAGDRTGNLFDGELVLGSFVATDGSFFAIDVTCVTEFINVKSNTEYSIHITGAEIRHIGYYGGTFSYSSPTIREDFTFVTPNDCNQIRIVFRKFDQSKIDLTIFPTNTIMLNLGSTALPYEPYGYKVPVTVEGKNLCNNIWEQKMINVNTGNASPNENTVCCDFIPVKPNVTYSCSRTIANNYNNLRCYGTNKNYLGTGTDLANKGNPLIQGAPFGTFMITDARVSYIRFNDLSNSLDTKYMLVEGVYTAETMPPYEPYYEPVTTNLYLPEPIKMVGDEAEYIDYAEQKMHRIGADDIDVTLPALPVLPGTNTLTVGTEVQPSGVEIKGRIKAAGGD